MSPKALSLSQQARTIATLAESLVADAQTIEETRAVRLVGLHEVSELLGLTKYHANTMRRRGQLPAPVAELACGPVWRTEDIEAFAVRP